LAPSWVAADELFKSTQMEAVAIARWRMDMRTVEEGRSTRDQSSLLTKPA